ncbi:MAG: hypothetical protein ACXWCY_16745 [Burkholderiales bacterium]
MHDKRNRWKIVRNENGTWSWRVSVGKGPENLSKRSFDTLEECMADAKSHGYVVRTEKDRRTRS